MPPRPSNKRDRASSSSNTPTASSSKKTRFVEPAEDPANFAEQVDGALEDPQANRKGRVKNEGYDSDSSDDGEGVVNSRKKEEEDEEEDMFNIKDDSEKAAESSSKKKDKSYMRLGDIEGQEFENSGSENSGTDSDEEPEDEDDEERRKKKGMGYELSSFNMRDEMDEGKFTDDGAYIRTFDVHAVHDKWMEDVDEKAIRKARKKKKEQDKVQKQRIIAEERELEQTGGKPALETALLSKLRRGETVLEALQRLGKARQPKPKPSANAMSVDKTSSSKSATASDIESITHIASTLMSLGESEIYSQTYEQLVRSVRSSATVPEDWTPPSADKKYEYKWDMPGSGMPEDTFGPFGEEEMQAWYKASYFGPTGEKVQVREVGGEWGDWDDVLS